MMIIDAAKRWSTRAEHTPHVSFESFFNRTDEFGQTVLELAVQRNHVNAVELILLNDPAYQHGQASKLHGLMHSIYKAIEKESSKKIVELLSDTYEAGIKPDQNGILAFLLAIQRRDRESIVGLLKGDDKHLYLNRSGKDQCEKLLNHLYRHPGGEQN
ncbi:hypothetical protein POM88_000805 [Heracleum sosnowskyi]|uniref:Uncharacterized protein n=1 Tax=Heracleum sosnowskyi TaxID=360622 RepID=A0AAD8JEY6_9APIA|nr:hypothetical protein POM88_000805 [Heracleum sosnowskyi]